MAVGVCPRTVRKWVKRFRAEGLAGLQDRSSRPHRLRRATPAATVACIKRLRRRWTGAQIARETSVSKATVSRILRRLGLNRLRALEPVEPVRRYERQHPGELIHIDIKKLGRIDGIGHRITGDRRGQSNRRGRGQGLGWEFVHGEQLLRHAVYGGYPAYPQDRVDNSLDLLFDDARRQLSDQFQFERNVARAHAGNPVNVPLVDRR